MRKKKVHVNDGLFSKFSHFSRESQWTRGRAPSCFLVHVLNSLECLCNVFRYLWILLDPTKTLGTLRI